MENDDTNLPAITIVEYGPYDTQFWRILVDAPWRRTRYLNPLQLSNDDPLNYTTPPPSSLNDMVSELTTISTSFQAALDYATQYLYNFVAAGYIHPHGHEITDLPPSRPKRTPKERMAEYRPTSLSPQAWEHIKQETARLHYDGRGYVGGTNAYLKALLAANPAPDCWRDTRPDYLQEADQERMTADPPSLPLWCLYDSPEEYRRVRMLNRANFVTHLQPVLIKLANHFLIAPTRFTTSEDARASATLEAIGLQYLTPTNPCPLNSKPPRKYSGWHDRHRSRQTGRSNWELSF